MTKLEAAPEAREGNSNLDKLSHQLADKEKARNLPDKIKVKNQALYYFGRNWIYEWERLRWWKNNDNSPCWKWIFRANDGTVFDGEWNKDWVFLRWKLAVNWRNYDIKGTRVFSADKTKISSLDWTGSIDWFNYSCTLDENLQIKKVEYAWVTLNFIRKGWNVYLKSSKGELRLFDASIFVSKSLGKLKSSWREDRSAVWLAKCISAVRNSWRTLDKFEGSPTGTALQADYKDKVFDVDLLDGVSEKIWASIRDLVDWLNACRHSDFWL